MAGLATLFQKKKGRRWRWSEADLPWFDQPNATQVLDKRRAAGEFTDAEYELVRNWVEHGYFVLDNAVSPELLEGMARDLANVWTTSEAQDGLILCDLRRTPDAPPQNMQHRELVEIPFEERLQIRDRSHWRVHEFFRWSKNAEQIHENPELTRLATLVMGRPTNPEYTITFMYGSRQHLHQDSCVFHLFPPNYLIGVWLACEDIHPESGPLVYYPGSHREKLFTRFDNYPQTNLKTCDKKTTAEYEEYLERTAARYERKAFLAKKGQALFWHGMLIHGGDAVQDLNRTRESYVCHYVPPGMKQDELIEGPFNW
jgi:ectoine hydroxylase-related dioxygenase (phytanoyl-CoA dioxygenase family)